jgi:uncharacterized protein
MIAGLLIGLIGSLHCLGMCGPLLLSLPFGKTGGWTATGRTFIYHSGRLATYGFLGILAGFAGVVVNLIIYQQYISVIAGVLMLVWIVLKYSPAGKKFTGASNIYLYLNKSFRGITSKNKWYSVFSLGILNGFLPCGLVYMAAIASISMADPFKSFGFMIFFGAGTLPALAGIMISRNLISNRLKFNPNKLIPVLASVMVILFIVRGLALGIPFISPQVEVTQTQEVKSCCVVDEKKEESSLIKEENKFTIIP